MRVTRVAWTPAMVERLAERARQGWSGQQIGDELGVSRCAAIARLSRLRAAGDPRVPPARPNPVQPVHRPDRDPPVTLADQVAEDISRGASSFVSIARVRGVYTREVKAAWLTIVDRLGWQAS